MSGSRKIKVLFIGAKAEIGGAYTCLLTLIRRMDRGRFEVNVVLPGQGMLHSQYQAAADRLDVLRYAVLQSPGSLVEALRMGIGLLRSTLAFRRHVRKQRPDVVFVSSVVNAGALLGARLAGARVLCHKLEIIESWKLMAWFLDWLALSCSKRVACISKAVARSFSRRLPHRSRIRVVYDAIDCDYFQPAAGTLRQEFSLKPTDFAVGLIARLVPWKGQEVLLQATSWLKGKLPGLRVLIVGGPVSPASERYGRQLKETSHRLGLDEQVIFTGVRKDLKNVIAGLDALVSLSTDPEPFGETLVQAMAMEKPVIACRLGGPAEIVDDPACGLLIPAKDPRALAEALETLARHPEERSRMGQSGRRRALALFDARQEARQMEALIQEAME